VAAAGAAGERVARDGEYALKESCFEVLDALGLAKLTKRTPTLDGAVPLRVAQACNPLLEGNAFGFQITLTTPLLVTTSLGRLSAVIADEARREALAAAHRSALARLVAQGFLEREGEWHRLLGQGLFQVERSGLHAARIRLWTGLLVRPSSGVWLRISGAGNRRNLLFEVDDVAVPDEGAFVPLILDLAIDSGAPGPVRLEGEIATIAPVAPDAEIDTLSLADAPDVGRAHAEFYDAAYFATKKGEVTRKYRRRVAREEAPRAPGSARCQVISAGPSEATISRSPRLLTRDGVRDAVEGTSGLRYVVHRNLVPFEARFDGHTLAIDPSARALAEAAAAVETTWTSAFGPTFVEQHRGALWYLTKYFTPHPPGEPHFFVKPCAFTRTAPGWSCLLEGVHGDGYDVMRGVVSTDVFFATPAVFRVHRVGEPIRVGAGEPLLHVLPIPRWMLHAGFEVAKWRDA
jgi:hypothetical protein